MSIHLVLERDGHDQPWGFRLQGGVDVALPLSVQRVLVGTPAESVLKKGDVVVKVGNIGTHNLTHQQAVDLFNAAGNQINLTVKRPGSGGVPAVATASSTISTIQHASSAAVLRQQQQQQQLQEQQQQQGDAPLSPQVAALPRTTFVLKSDLPPSTTTATTTADQEDLTVTNQPYRTLPLIQPSAKAINQLGVGSYSHLKVQEEICSGVREPQLVPVTPAQANAIKNNDLIMQQKTQQGLVSAATDHQKTKTPPVATTGPIPGPVPVKLPASPSLGSSTPSPQPAKYNSAAGLYANQSTGYLNKKTTTTSTGMINPSAGRTGRTPPLLTSVNRPHKNLPFFALAKKYDPEQSATWQAIHEMENCQLVTEHGPTESKVYSI